MVAFDVLINCVLFGVRLIVLKEGVIVIADGSCGELLTKGSPLVSLIIELLVRTGKLLISTGLPALVKEVTFAGVLVDTFVTIVDFVGAIEVTELLELLLTGVVLPVFEGLDEVVVMVALLRSLLAKRLLMRVEVLVVAGEVVEDED